MKKFGIRKYIVFLVDLAVTAFAYALYAVLRERSITEGLFTKDFGVHLAVLLVLAAAVRLIFYGYDRVWRYAVATDYIEFVFVDAITFLLFYIADRMNVIFTLVPGVGYTDIVPILCVYGVSTLLILVTRFIYIVYRGYNRSHSGEKKSALIVGAGEAGVLLADELMSPKSLYDPVAFVDTDNEKIGKKIRGVKVYDEKLGAEKIISECAADTAIIAIPSLSLDGRKRLVKAYTDAGCKVRIYDYQMNREDESSGKLKVRDVRIEDLLGRDAVQLDTGKCRESLKGKRVLVTGAGGSIGSELCRQIADSCPETLIMLDICENGLYDVQQELKRRYGARLSLAAVVASVCNTDSLDEAFEKYRPEIVFHAAAHKHVPLMEDCCREAVENNVFGTNNVASACEKYGVAKMLLISTDKAVNPTNVMGATKRLCEMILMSRHESKTEYVAVRFGNVLGSNGSVIPLFKRQIEEGGPVTVTDKRIVRYFMTIPEAVSLVLETETMASDSEIFVLDMGDPVKILDLAESMVTLSGYRPYKDIDIIEIGLRPGEKLYEELLITTDSLEKTANNKIFIDRGTRMTSADMESKLLRLRSACESGDESEVRRAICDTVPTYSPTDNEASRRNATYTSCGAKSDPDES